jgi:hypothetical protein
MIGSKLNLNVPPPRSRRIAMCSTAGCASATARGMDDQLLQRAPPRFEWVAIRATDTPNVALRADIEQATNQDPHRCPVLIVSLSRDGDRYVRPANADPRTLATLPNRSEGEAAELPCVRYTSDASAEHANLLAAAADIVRGRIDPPKARRSRFRTLALRGRICRAMGSQRV